MMPCCPRFCVPFAVILAAFLVLSLNRDTPAAKPAAPELAMFGVDGSRNLANTVDKNLPTAWSVEEGKPRQNIKWVAKLGNKAYGCAVVSGGKVYVATNNDVPRDPGK